MMHRFITFEGCEGSGKSTQAKLLKHNLELLGHKVILTREPGGTPLAEKLREILLSGEKIDDTLTEFLLITTARRDHIMQKIKPHLDEGYIVICDRFYHSSLVYQGIAGGLNIESMTKIINLTIDAIKPDITFLIDIDPELAIKRIKEHRKEALNHYDKMGLEFHKKIRDGFLAIAEMEKTNFVTVNGNNTQKKIGEEILSMLHLS
jgi:dTMP kinase